MNTTTRFTIVDDLSWLTERIILAGEQLLNPQGSALLDIREFSWFNYKRQDFSFFAWKQVHKKFRNHLQPDCFLEPSIMHYRFISIGLLNSKENNTVVKKST